MRPRRADPLDVVVANFRQLEQKMLECMQYIPFVAQNESVVSPKFIPIILESCTLIESVLRRSVRGNQRHTFKSYCALAEPRLKLMEVTSLLLTSPMHFLKPFETWTTAIPDWWSAYNQLQHDRIKEHDAATYGSTINALPDCIKSSCGHQISQKAS